MNQEPSVLSLLWREPGRASNLLKLSAVSAAGILAWDVLGPSLVADAGVKAVLVLAVLVYGGLMTYVAARIIATSRETAAVAPSAVSRLLSARPTGSEQARSEERRVGREIGARSSPG